MNIKEKSLQKIMKIWANYDEIMAILASLPFGCNLWSRDLKIINCNKQMLMMLGVSSKNQYFKDYFTFMPRYLEDGVNSEEEIKKRVWEAFEKGRVNFNWIYHDVRGREIPATVTLDRVQVSGEIHVISYIVDTREMVSLTEKARQTEDMIRLLFDQSPFSCSLWNRKYEIVACNQEAVKLFKVSGKLEYYDKIRELSPSVQPDGTDSILRIKSALDEAFEKGYTEFEWMHHSKDGEEIPSANTLIRVVYDGEEYVAAYIRDLREQKAADKKLREADRRTKVMLDASPLCCNLWDEKGRIIDCNEASVKLSGANSKKDYLRWCSMLFPEYQPDGSLSREKHRRMISKALQSGEKLNFEWMYQSLDGELIPAEVTMKRIGWNDGCMVVSYTRDLRRLQETIDLMGCLGKMPYKGGGAGVYNG